MKELEAQEKDKKFEKSKVLKIPETTKIVLQNLNKKWNWIVRDVFGTVEIHEEKPELEDIVDWASNGDYEVVTKILDSTLFDFLTFDNSPINIKEILENGKDEKRKRRGEKNEESKLFAFNFNNIVYD